jgi:uncharacterized protein YodC (DUF2158 family)
MPDCRQMLLEELGMSDNEIKEGDTVQLKSGDPTRMMVEWAAEEFGTMTAGCSWLDKNQNKKSAKWNVAVLKKV